MLRNEEGERLTVYKCPAGYLTIGIGRNLETNGLTKAECDKLGLVTSDKIKVIGILQQRGINKLESEYLLSNDIDRFSVELGKCITWFLRLPETAKIVLCDMAFNLGVDGLLKFKKTLSLIEKGNYKEASKEMLNSDWAEQVGRRARNLSFMLYNI